MEVGGGEAVNTTVGIVELVARVPGEVACMDGITVRFRWLRDEHPKSTIDMQTIEQFIKWRMS